MSNAVHACSTERHEPLSEKGELHIISTNVSSNLAEKMWPLSATDATVGL